MKNLARNLKRLSLIWRFGLVAILAVASGVMPFRLESEVTAAAGPSVYLDPPSQSPVNGISTVAIKIKNVSNLSGVEVHLSFNPSVLQVQDFDSNKAGIQIAPANDLFPFTPGQYFVTPGTGEKYYYRYTVAEGGYFIARGEADNATGTIDYGIVVLNPASPVSAGADGKVLATVTFSSLGQGAANIGFAAQGGVKLADSAGLPISVPPENIAGAVIQQQGTYTLTMAVNPVGAGTTSPVAGTHSYPAGTSVNITAIASGGWQFDNWTGDVASSTLPSTTVTMNSDKTVTANFVQEGGTTYTLTLVVNPPGAGTTSPAAGTYSYPAGTSVNITASASGGWQFENWIGEVASPTSPSTTVTMNGNKAVTANFSQTVVTYSLTLAVNPQGAGTTSPAAGVHSYPAGTSVNITASASGGWQFQNWSGEVASPISPSTTVTMNANKSVTANFIQTPVTYNLTLGVNPVGAGTTSPVAGTYSYPAGTSVNVTATPNGGWTFSQWSGNVTGTSNPVTILMNSDKTVTANFVAAVTPIGAIKQNPQAFEGTTVKLSGEFRGWEAGHGTQPRTRSDWVIRDVTGSIYVTGPMQGKRVPQDIGKPVVVTGVVRLKDGVPYIEATR